MHDGGAAERLIPIARSGSACWYEVPQGLELYAMRTPQELRIHNREQSMRWGQLKQTHVTAWDRVVMRDAAQTMRLSSYHTLHPAWMYHFLAPYWTGRAGPTWLIKRVAYPTIQAPPLPQGLTLPEPFICACSHGV